MEDETSRKKRYSKTTSDENYKKNVRQISPHIQNHYSDLKNTEEFKQLIHKKRRVRLSFVFIIGGLFGLYIITWGYFPGWVNQTMPGPLHISRGVGMTIGLVITNIILSALYTFFSAKKMDALTDKMLLTLYQEKGESSE